MKSTIDWRPGEIGGKEDRLRSMWEAGCSSPAIAEALGIGRGAVMGRIRRLGLQTRRGKKRAHDKNTPKRTKVVHRDFMPPPPTGCLAVESMDTGKVVYCGAAIKRSGFCRKHAPRFLQRAGTRARLEAADTDA